MTEIMLDDQAIARDGSRLSTIAYWLARYRDHANQDLIAEKFDDMLRTLETDDAREIATAWFERHEPPSGNRFAGADEQIWNWARQQTSSRHASRQSPK